MIRRVTNEQFMMKNFNRKGKTPDWKQGGGFGEKKTKFRANCAKCKRPCEVPFKPNGSKPVFCSDCFEKEHDFEPKRFGRDSGRMSFDSGPKRFGGQNSGYSGFEQKQMFRTQCDQCGDPCEVPFRPSGEKPVYCSDCFGHGGDARVKHSGKNKPAHNDQLMDQFVQLNQKLDTLIELIKTPAVVHTISLQDQQKKSEIESTKEKKSKKVVEEKETKAKKSDTKKEAKPKKEKKKATKK